MKIDEVKPYPNNPRNNDDGVEAVANSIKEFDWQQPIVVDKDNVIIVGHTRYKAAKKLGMDKVPVVVASNLSDEQVRAYRLADNKTGELTDWDMSLLDDELEDIADIDMSEHNLKLVKERDDLGLKISKLKKFMKTDKFHNLDKDDQELLKAQKSVMKTYKHILNERISWEV